VVHIESILETEILCVGAELLMGQIVNTNAAFIANQLALQGLASHYQTVVGDNPGRLAQTMKDCLARCDCLITTGGLGPTQDDITMEIAALVAGRKLALHQPSLDVIESMFRGRGHVMTDNNRKQAMLPEGCQVLPNANGTAPGAIVEFEMDGKSKAVILLPGPPNEMQAMFREQALPYLAKRSPYVVRNYFVRMNGIGESQAEDMLKDLIQAQTNPTIASYVSPGEVMFRVTQFARDSQEPDRAGDLVQEIRRRMAPYVYEVGPRSMKEVAADLLKERGLTVSFAESCTVGMVSSLFGDIPGISKVFKGSIVCYANEIKTSLLGVPESVLEQFGAVSEECVTHMANGCRKVMNTDYAVAVSGVAGPDAAPSGKPVGLVYFAAADASGCEVRKVNLPGDRARIRSLAASNVFDLLRRRLLPR
jgi:nicotinamide-nucleotide amidase